MLIINIRELLSSQNSANENEEYRVKLLNKVSNYTALSSFY